MEVNLGLDLGSVIRTTEPMVQNLEKKFKKIISKITGDEDSYNGIWGNSNLPDDYLIMFFADIYQSLKNHKKPENSLNFKNLVKNTKTNPQNIIQTHYNIHFLFTDAGRLQTTPGTVAIPTTSISLPVRP